MRSGLTSTASFDPDAREAHQRLSRQAAALTALSITIATEALAVADAYAGALSVGNIEAWSAFVAAAAVVAEHSASIASIVSLSVREREASSFFAQIVSENADLLVAHPYTTSVSEA